MEAQYTIEIISKKIDILQSKPAINIYKVKIAMALMQNLEALHNNFTSR